MIVVLDHQTPVRSRPTIALSAPSTRSVVLGLATAPARSISSDWPKWLVSFENTSKSVARSGHRKSRRND
jgi:hypothetical protein